MPAITCTTNVKVVHMRPRGRQDPLEHRIYGKCVINARIISSGWYFCAAKIWYVHKPHIYDMFVCVRARVRVYCVHHGHRITGMQYTLYYIFAQISRERGKKIIIQNIKLVRHMCIKNITHLHQNHQRYDTCTDHKPCATCIHHQTADKWKKST